MLQPTDVPTINIALDTIKLNKQALIFVNTKSSAEKSAEDIAKRIKTIFLKELSEKALNALSTPTKQCKRLAKCLEKGVAFHHAGLSTKQRHLIEDNFRTGVVKIICCTPTLCLSKDTTIWHGISETKINKSKSKEFFVLSQNKLIKMKAKKIQKIKNSSNLVEIYSALGYSIKVTTNHKMLIKRNNRKIICEASSIKKGDRIATIGHLELKKTSKPKIKDFIKDNKIDVINYKFDENLSYFIGAMLGDGHSGAEITQNKIKYTASASIVGVDKEIFEIIEQVCKKLNNTNCRSAKNSHGTPQLILSKSKWFREFLIRCGIEKREDKHISERLMKMSLENAASLLRGLFDTDGCVEKRIGPSFSNISEKLVKQIQKLLLRFGIVSSIRKRIKGPMQIHGKKYDTKPIFELGIYHKRSVLDFYRYIGFKINRKQEALTNVVARIASNLNYVSCRCCKYKIHSDLFSGRSEAQKIWGKTKRQIIMLLGRKGELGSKEIKTALGKEPRKKVERLNHHYYLIKKRRVGSRSNAEWLWSLNAIGKWIFENTMSKKKKFEMFFGERNCPLCGTELDWVIKKGWRDQDFDGDIFWDIVKNTQKVPVEEDVCDVVLSDTPKNDHMFVANGFIVHNSYGLDLPAFRSVIKDLKRYGGSFGMTDIPVLEYLQMAGRAGRPGKETFGESICIANSESQKQDIQEKYLHGIPENIYSKLAVEPVLRTYLLSLIATNFVNSKKTIMNFFEKTFWAKQFQDLVKLEQIINKMLALLEEWGFILTSEKTSEFIKASEVHDDKIRPTALGQRVAQLYLDPLTADQIIQGIKATSKDTIPFSYLHLVSSTLEIRPQIRVRTKDYDQVQEKWIAYEDNLLLKEPSSFSTEFDDFLNSIKTGLFFQDWIEEKGEDYLLEEYKIRPGELKAKLNIADWLLYGTEELARIMQYQHILNDISKLRVRLKNGVREELLPLLKLKGVGRKRARLLYNNRLRTLGDLKTADQSIIAQIIGGAISKSIKEQLGQEVKEIKQNRRKGQISLLDY
jgi:helicase